MKLPYKYVIVALLITAISHPTTAQNTTPPPSAPVLLLPDAGLVGTDELPSEVNANQTQVPTTTIIETSSGGIAVESLKQIDPEILGTLDDSKRGLGFEMWAGTDRLKIHSLISHLPSEINSAALRDLTRRLMLTTADITPHPANIENSPTLTQLRVKQLLKMGLLDDAVALIELAKQTGVGEALREDYIEALLFLNDFSAVCTQVAIAKDKLGEAYWQKLLVFCQALSGDTSGAEFGTTLLSDMGEDDPIFFTLIEKLTQNNDAKLETMPNPTALHMAMAELTKTALPIDVLNTKNPSVWRAIAANSATADNMRLEAAERAALVAAIPIKTLIDLYKTIEFSPEERNNPISTAEADNSSRNRALLYQTAEKETVPEARALLVQKAISLAKQIDLYPLAIAVHQGHILQISPSSDVWWFAGDAARALYATGRSLPAQSWLGHLRTQALRNPEAQAQLINFWPLAGISAKGLLPTIDDDARKAWVDSQRASAPDERSAANRITMGYVLLDSLDQKIPDNAWTTLAQMAEASYARLPNPAIAHMMLNSAVAGRRGEAVAWVISLLGELGTSHAGPETTAQAVIALRALGLQKEARAIALEAAITNGL